LILKDINYYLIISEERYPL